MYYLIHSSQIYVLVNLSIIVKRFEKTLFLYHFKKRYISIVNNNNKCKERRVNRIQFDY